MNVLTIAGNLGGDCRQNTVGGTDVVNFSVAMTSGYGDKKQTHWVDCAYWGAGGKAVAQYLTKGQKVAVSGELSMKPANEKYAASFALRVNSLTLCGGRDSGVASVKESAPAQAASVDDDDSLIPF